ncbi:unnamed protein product [Meloidogyne enterolobii]|uniref:Uncharacterized protein n=1 Tax=Meloidogyne enterolobii TaxID=390850 RepID=A0ACB0Z2I2_MELEN
MHPRLLCNSQNNSFTENRQFQPRVPYNSTNYSHGSYQRPMPLFSNYQPVNQPVYGNYTPMANNINEPVNQTVPTVNPENNPVNPVNPPQTNVSSVSAPRGSILLKCVRAHIFNPKNPSFFSQVIVLLDDASTNTYIHFAKAKELQLPLTPTSMNLGVFNNPYSIKTSSFLTEFGIRLADGRSLTLKANTLDHLTQPTRYVPFSPSLLSYSNELIFQPETVVPVVLLGSDFYYDIEPTPIMKLPSGYTLVHTLLGIIVAGKPYDFAPNNFIRHTNCITQETTVPPSDFFTLEGIGINDEPTPVNSQNDTVYEETIKNINYVNGRYEVKLPFKSDPSSIPLPSNFGLCFGRLRSVYNSLQKTPELLNKYNDIISEQSRLGIIESPPNPNSYSYPLHYLAHHPVVQPEKGKVRIVYDGSAHTGKTLSLNDCLHPGPSIVPELVGLLFRFRIPKIAVICDIEKAFLQISVHPSHRDVTRFLWLKDINLPPSPSNIKIFRFARVAFGLAPSPFLLAATIRSHLSKYSCPLSKEVENNIYVDNILISAQTTTEGNEKCKSISQIFKEANMKVREFASNSLKAIEIVPKEDQLPGHSHKFLGIGWNTLKDLLSIKILRPSFKSPPSKRSILAFTASHYDPLGLISPIILPLKIFLQSLWKEKLKWDEKLSPEAVKDWNKLQNNWKEEVITVPRRCFSSDTPGQTHELHCFTDASSLAMCATVYLKTSSPNSSRSEVSLLFSKTKVKPIPKKGTNLTIPRLELISVQMGSKALKFVLNHLNNITIHPTLNLWTDSSTVLSWLNSTTPIP